MAKTIADELAKKQQSISVSEFFTKNRHLLGFDNPRRALLTAIKEAVDNSLTEDMPIVIREDGNFKIIKIGGLIDSYFDKNKGEKFILRDGNLEKLKLKNNIEAISFDPKTLKVQFKKISYLYRHKPNSPIFRMKLETGRYVDLTPYHSVFTIKEGNVCSVKLSDLTVGDYIIVPRKEWGKKLPIIKEINLIEELLRLEPELTAKINVYNVSNIFTKEIIKQLKELLPKDKQYRVNDFKKMSYIPLNLLRKLIITLDELDDTLIGYSLSRNKIPSLIKVDNNFAQLMGFYLAEGSTLSNLEKVYFSFGSHEKEMIVYTKDLIYKVFKIKASSISAHDSAVNICCYSKIFAFIMKYILQFGMNAKSKTIPGIIFNMNKNNRYDLLLAYLAGDGYPSKDIFELIKTKRYISSLPVQKITSATISSELFTKLQYLLSSLGLNYNTGFSKSKTRYLSGIEAKFSQSYYLYIYTNQKNSNINKLPISDSIVSHNDCQLRHRIKIHNQNGIYRDTLIQQNNNTMLLYKNINLFLDSDLGVLRIKDIKEISYNGKWVYDISVPEAENFLAGIGPIFCHNSLDACQEAKILPSIKLVMKQLQEDRYYISVEDNGPGIVKKQIPNIFAKLLYGSKFFTMKQQRGQQGIGISAAVLYSQLTTGKSAKITSKIGKNHPAHYYELKIDTKNNEPEIVVDKEVQFDSDHGTKIELEMEAIYQKGARGVDEYLKQTAIANPHAEIIYIDPEGKTIIFPMATKELPKESKEIKPHPHGIELGIFISMLSSTKTKNLSSFLTNDFIRISGPNAKKLIEEAEMKVTMKPNSLNSDQAEKLYKIIQKAKIMAPPTNCLSPIGEEALQKSLEKEVPAEFFASVTRPATVYRGNPFVIEAAIAYGGQLEQEGPIKLLRFANRVPLQYQQSACAITKSVIDTNWRNYNISQSKGALPQGPIVVAVHMASVWVPFTSESKEAVAHYPEIIKQIKMALQECGRKLASHIRKTVRVREQKERASLFEKYIPEIASALSNLTKEKKDNITDKLNKILKKSLKNLLSEELEEKDGEKDKTKQK